MANVVPVWKNTTFLNVLFKYRAFMVSGGDLPLVLDLTHQLLTTVHMWMHNKFCPFLPLSLLPDHHSLNSTVYSKCQVSNLVI